MANGNGNGLALTPAKTIGICVSVTIAINTLALSWMQDTSREVDDLRRDLERKTDQRYRQTDANRDFKLVEYRFSRNEANIDQCLEHIKDHE